MSEKETQQEAEENKTPDKKQIELEEKEKMLKVEEKIEEPVKGVNEVSTKEGPVKTALAVSEEGREVKPKYIPIGGIKMPGFFTRNTDKDKQNKVVEEEIAELGGDSAVQERPGRMRRLRMGLSCPFTQFLHRSPPKPNEKEEERNESSEPIVKKRFLDSIRGPLSGMFGARPASGDPEAALASMETLGDKLDTPGTPNDGMENVKLDGGDDETPGSEVVTKLPFHERIRQKKFIIDDFVVGVVVVLVAAFILGGVVAALSQREALREPPIRDGHYITAITTCGPVEGVLDKSAFNFYGIPYAQPPIGERRWQPAKPLDSLATCWNGTLKAHNATASCWQVLANSSKVGQEDCLTLDIVTPHVRYHSPLPVVVLIGADNLYNGLPGPLILSPSFARTKDIVIVRPNFRVGAFGFLALRALSENTHPKSSGNYGLTDIVEALRWINKNIKHFGGDAAQITVVGHRAGGTLVTLLTSSEVAKRLFARAWVSSPSTNFPGKLLQESEMDNLDYMKRANCSDAVCLRALTPEQVMSAVPDTWLRSPADLPLAQQPGQPEPDQTHSWLVLDGILLKEHHLDLWKPMQPDLFPKVIMSATEHSAHSQWLLERHTEWTAALVKSAVEHSAIGNLSEEALTFYNSTYKGLVRMISSIRDVCPILTSSQTLKVQFYLIEAPEVVDNDFTDVNADMKAIFGTYEVRSPQEGRYVTNMQNVFCNFVWHRRPQEASDLTKLAQDPLKLQPEEYKDCEFWVKNNVVPRYGRVD